MKLTVLEVTFRLEGCQSLKEKRSRMSGLKRLKEQEQVLVFESDYQDQHQISKWTLVAGASSERVVDQIVDQLEAKLEDLVDATICGLERGDIGL